MSIARFTPDDYYPAGRDALALAEPTSRPGLRDRDTAPIRVKHRTPNYSVDFREVAAALRLRACELDAGKMFDKCLSLAAYFERAAEEAERGTESLADRR